MAGPRHWGVQTPVRVWLNSGDTDTIEGILEATDEAGVRLSGAKKGEGGKGGDIGETFIPYTAITRVDRLGEGRNIAQEQIEGLRRRGQ